MTWVAVAIGGAALIGGAASYAGSKKQSDAAKDAAKLSQGQYQNNVQMQSPYIQSGYGALGKLSTLLGINPDPNAPVNYQPTQNMPQVNAPGISNQGGGPRDWNYHPIMENAPPPVVQPQPTQQKPNSNPQLRQILQIRADSGDPQAKQLLGMIQ